MEANWPEPSLGVPPELFVEALSETFQASLTTEEGRPTRFRLLLTPIASLPAEGVPNEGVLRLRFARTRPLRADDLRRLAPVAPFETSLIGAHVEAGELRIWGVAHSGPAWLAPTWGGRSPVPNWTYDPIVHATGPGRIAVRCAGRLVGAIERGIIVDATIDVFESKWLPALFAREREDVRSEHAAMQAKHASPTTVEHSLVGSVGQHMIRRAIQLVRGRRHGGLILMGGDLEGLRLKYRIDQDEPARRYHTLLLEILDAVAASSTKSSVGWCDFVLDTSPALTELEEAIFELARVYANLTAIDGALVLDKQLGLLAFGAEVSGELSAPARIWRALDNEGDARELDDIENVGTRHRAAYRFVYADPDRLALVISQDGGVKVVANRNGEVVFWEQSVGV